MGSLSDAQQIQIQRLQENLFALRRIAGWTMEELGKKIGVTKQTISNLESSNKKAYMTLTQYLAIRSVLDYEAAARLQADPNDTLLALAIQKVLDEDLDGDERKTAEGDVALVAAAVAGNAPNSTVKELAHEKLEKGSDNKSKIAVARAIAHAYTTVGTLGAATVMLGAIPGLQGAIVTQLILGTTMSGWMKKLLSTEQAKVTQEQNESNKSTKGAEK